MDKAREEAEKAGETIKEGAEKTGEVVKETAQDVKARAPSAAAKEVGDGRSTPPSSTWT